MSLGEVRYGGEQHATSNDPGAIITSHGNLLLELRYVTATIAKNATLSALLDIQFASNFYQSSDVAWLEANDLSAGRHYDDSTLPFPHVAHVVGPTFPAKSSTPSHDSIDQTKDFVNRLDAARPELTPGTDLDDTQDEAKDSLPRTLRATENLELRQKRSPSLPVRDRTPVQPKHEVLPAVEASKSTPENGVTVTVTTDENTIIPQEHHRSAKTVHLPSEREQLERLRERREAEHELHSNKPGPETTGPSINLHVQTEQVSSPSSTIGAYSAATPGPPQDSPDTSPNSEVDDIDTLVPKDLRPTAEEKAAQEEHDRLLAAQKEIAKRAAMGDDATPDDQLKWEEREAVAREAEERAVREKNPFSAGDVLDAIKKGQAEQLLSQTTTSDHVTSALTVLDKAPEESRQDDENITVKARNLTQSSTHAQEEGITATEPTSLNDKLMTDDTQTSSSTITHEKNNDIASHPRLDAIKASHAPKRFVGQSSILPPPPKSLPISDLSVLKGAAEDPDRDYLEPLFRIQAHDSPNARTRPLPNLVKDAAKCLSTEDHYTTLHERLDYRILRRIYQLQNANKWSLRQMEKCKEPEQPVTHLDHMMAEMQSMRKDFKAERKMKRNICAWLAHRCATWVAATPETRLSMQVTVKRRGSRKQSVQDESPPELDHNTDSGPEDEATPSTPQDSGFAISHLVVDSDLMEVVGDLHEVGKLGDALRQLPVKDLFGVRKAHSPTPMTTVSKFVDSKILPPDSKPIRKRSRFEYYDDDEELEEHAGNKRLCAARSLAPEDDDVALFHPDNKHIRDRLHANNAFRPPSEFVMPSISFYEFRNGSQWIWEDDQKLRKLAKEYCFNWSLIADEMTLPSRYKSSAERRTPWECFERWVELETLPAEMRKTMYFKTWYQRLEQSQQAAERRHQAQVAAIQQAQNSQVPVPTRRRTNPTRVEKRKNSRYLWLVDSMRKLARKRETNAYKQADSQRLAAQRKAQTDSTQQPRGPMLTPQEFSKRRYERDLSIAEAQRQHRQKLLEAQQRQLQLARAAQQQQQAQHQQGSGAGAGPLGQRPLPVSVPGHPGRPGVMNAQLSSSGMQLNGQVPPPNRPAGQMRTSSMNMPMMNGQSMPTAQIRPGSNMAQHADMQRLAQANAQRNAQYGNQAYHLSNNPMSAQNVVMTPQQQQQMANNPAMVAQMHSQQGASQSHGGKHNQVLGSNSSSHQGNTSPSMPPPPTPHGNNAAGQNTPGPQQLSSGHVPALLAIKNDLRHKNPLWTEDQLNHAATHQLSQRSRDQSSPSVRQSAMNAAAGIHGSNGQQYSNVPAPYQNAAVVTNGTLTYPGNEHLGTAQGVNQSPQAQAYAAQMRQRQMQLMRMQQQQQHQQQPSPSPNPVHVQLNESPNTTHASPNMAPASPSMTFNPTPGVANVGRPPSRSNTPQAGRVSASPVNVNNVSMNNNVNGNGMQSPGALQSSPRVMQANMAR